MFPMRNRQPGGENAERANANGVERRECGDESRVRSVGSAHTETQLLVSRRFYS